MEQYFTEQPTAIHQERNFTFKLRNFVFQFTSDNGVFSKQTVDYGTRTLIEALDIIDLPAGKLLDLGCGYGPIGLTLARLLPQREIDMVDVNQRAIDLAQKNAQNNQINNVHIQISNIYQQLQQQKYAAIYTNPPIRAGKEVVSTMIVQAPLHLASQGQLWLVVQKKQGEPTYKKLMQQAFGNVEIIKRDKGYYVLKSVKTKN
ncbi:class I SAM-dependent methyltransferase [Bombilactobacillus bombi]|uniref:class I SAM-dependent methyltransferase n=1 Tax=Bombilactobacillus bombi TaxID=1303590 RepID=UPI0015E5DF59|nr:class I SAM-dependent methyltransferase [Bombilactobacillus bombi]MBA1435128.1 class I SAM-dependent methyltransferase [Bombilactobacillus bombi]